ncbi:MAG: RNA polymerase sigma factor [Lachnospiraceae bacterium]
MRQEELETYIHDYGRDLYSFCCFLTRDRQKADDLYQDTFLKLIEEKKNMEIEKNPKSFLMGIAVNLYRNQKRKLENRFRIIGGQISTDELEVDIPSADTTTEEQVIRQQQCELIRREVETLPDRYRIPILLYYMEEQSIEQIANIVKLPQTTVKSHLHRAKKILKKKLEEHHYER